MSGVTAAERLLMSLGISQPNEIDLDAIAWHVGALVKYRHIDNADATIIGSLTHAVIAVNTSTSPARRRFSLAHELGHWHHHRGQILFCGASDIGNLAGGPLDPERQADAFASDLILPSYLIRPYINKLKKLTLAFVRDVANEFNTSTTATLIKILNEDRFPILLVCHGKNKRRWFRRAQMVPDWWFPREDLDADSFAFGILHAGNGEDTFPRKNGAGAWFEFRNVDRYEVLEQSFPLPNDEVLTVLTVPEEGLG
ncbi:MAG: ImmA/IrrE family metallo-endopeptidase [Xanthobacteraceae bacterium]|nr:ImmA/IrrE family metallo-endopeptidase [Xanthobacteraceae bacterium]